MHLIASSIRRRRGIAPFFLSTNTWILTWLMMMMMSNLLFKTVNDYNFNIDHAHRSAVDSEPIQRPPCLLRGNKYRPAVAVVDTHNNMVTIIWSSIRWSLLLALLPYCAALHHLHLQRIAGCCVVAMRGNESRFNYLSKSSSSRREAKDALQCTGRWFLLSISPSVAVCLSVCR